MTSHILVIDDDPVQRRLLTNMIERLGHVAHLADNGRSGLELLQRKGGIINVILLDLLMPEMNGHGLLEALAERGIDIPVIVQTGQGGIETVVQAMQAGAFDFLVKPVSPERLSIALGNALKMASRDGKVKTARRPRGGAVGFDDIVSASPAMIRVIDLARRAAQSNIPIVLEGESGVGKEMVARAIQAASDRAAKPFVTVNCGAIPTISSRAFSSAMRRERLRARAKSTAASSSMPTAAPSFSTKSAIFRSTYRSSCCAPSSRARSRRSGRVSRRR